MIHKSFFEGEWTTIYWGVTIGGTSYEGVSKTRAIIP
jgi:hypothetical protein